MDTKSIMKLSFIGTIKKPSPKLIQKAQQQNPQNLDSLLDLLNYPESHKPFIIATSAGKRLKADSLLTPDMEIELTVLVGGG